jgi:hypothetical protein
MQEEASIPTGTNVNAYMQDTDMHEAEVALLVIPPFQRARAMALARALSALLSLDDMEILELPLLRCYFDALIQHAQVFFRGIEEEMQDCDRVAMRQQIESEESKIDWSGIYATKLRDIRVESHYDNLMQTLVEPEERISLLPEPEQSTPDLLIAYYGARHTRDLFKALLEGIATMHCEETEWKLADLKRPYRALEKMALDDTDRKWTSRCVMDLSRGSIVCSNTDVMQDMFKFLDACTSEVRSGDRQHPYAGLMQDLPEVRIVMVKNRFKSPTPSGWADIFINFVFDNDKLFNHVHELQIQHRKLVCIRKEFGEYSRYAGLRVLAELLQKTCGTATQETKRP